MSKNGKKPKTAEPETPEDEYARLIQEQHIDTKRAILIYDELFWVEQQIAERKKRILALLLDSAQKGKL